MRNTVALLSLTVILSTATQLNAQFGSTMYLSVAGNDLNPCTRAAPCLSFYAKALQPVLNTAGGQIVILDSGEFYHPEVIAASVIVEATGVDARITGGFHIIGLTKTVVLRGLHIIGETEFLGGGSLTVENCTITGSGTYNGIWINGTDGANAFISNTLVNQFANGVEVNPAAGTNTAVLDNVQVVNSAIGLGVTAGGVAHVSRSTFSFNSAAGVTAVTGKVHLNSTEISANAVGLELFGGALARLSNVNIHGNVVGFNTSGGILNSFGNNYTCGNLDGVQPTVNSHPSPL